jgi:uncharacterized protein (DUF934 family)
MQFIPSSAELPAGTLELNNTDDVLALAETIRGRARVALQFPKWTDGRAYSQAVLLRGRLRYAGEIVATGDIVVDMVPLLRRCGFDTARLRADQPVEVALRQLGHFDDHYQRTLAERHGPGEGARP